MEEIFENFEDCIIKKAEEWGSRIGVRIILNNSSDVKKVSENSLMLCSEAISRNAFYPHAELAGRVLQFIKQYRNEFSKKSNRQCSAYFRKEKEDSFIATCNEISKLEDNISLFEAMKYAISKHIKLEAEPIEGEILYLAQGRLILPTKIITKGYHVFSISSKQCAGCGSKELSFNPLTKYGLSSVEEAKRRHTEKDELMTVVIARNTEHYPLFETVLPIIKEKYLLGSTGNL